jgi:murein DD-endopeptidase MepM/ murein hydrolase activator NlpD
MSKRVAGQALRIAAFAGVMAGSAALAGCSTLGLGMGGDDVTGSIAPQPSTAGVQAMPQTLKPVSTQVATGPFTPPENVGGGSGALVTGNAPAGYVSSSTLPPLTGSDAMPAAQPAYSPAMAKTASLATPASTLKVVPEGVYTHVIESGESLYTIARHYDVSAQAIISANGLSSADKIFVGQRIVIPGRSDLLAAMDKGGAPKPAPAIVPAVDPTKTAALPPVKAADPVTAKVATPVQVATASPMPAKIPAAEPVMSGADKFRWPVSGKVTTDFIASKGTGINIDAPEGTAVRAAENGTVIYVGSGVEGYGNLVLIRHPNGYVSAYAHLGSIGVTKGDAVNRGDSIGVVGMTGSVSRPQLHFELRMGATPVDPIPLLAG